MKIAIQGHPTRGEEVIQILESLGGKNGYNQTGSNVVFVYFITNIGLIYSVTQQMCSNERRIYTLEEFEKEFPFKIGDRVISVTTNSIGTITKLKENGWYYVRYDNGNLVCVSRRRLKLYKEMERNVTLTIDKAKEWYQKGGELREVALQAFTKEELNPLPRSWEEYCKYNSTLTTSFSSCAKYDAFVKLEHLRDCWLGGWTPKWDTSEKWCIRLYKNQLHVGLCTDISRFLTFPTKEMAEDFLECFWDLIETARNLI